MKKALGKSLFVAVLALGALLGMQKQLVQPAMAVEIQPGTGIQPETSQAELGRHEDEDDLPALEVFIQRVMDGQPGSVRGLYIPGMLALRIVQQPDQQYDFVSYEEDTATQFQSPSLFGVIGLLAHNFLSGRLFFEIQPGQTLTIVYGDGQTENYLVDEIHDYQRMSELDMHSDFLDLQDGQTLSADQVFQRYYQGDRHLTLQTCLERSGNWNWGIRMITAYPVSTMP